MLGVYPGLSGRLSKYGFFDVIVLLDGPLDLLELCYRRLCRPLPSPTFAAL